MAANEDTSTPKEKTRLFSRWRRKAADPGPETEDVQELEGLQDIEGSPQTEGSQPAEGFQPTEGSGADNLAKTHDDSSNSSQAVESAVIQQPQLEPVQEQESPPLSAVEDHHKPGVSNDVAHAVVDQDSTVADTDEHHNITQQATADIVEKAGAPAPEDTPKSPKRANLFSRALSKTGRGLETLFLGRRQIDDQLFEELETELLMADVGVEVCTDIIEELTDQVKRRELSDSGALRAALHGIMVDMLVPCEQPLDVSTEQPFVLLVVGVNGVGKTTTIGKLARSLKNQGYSVMLAAGDTFRAAAVEQLQAWGDRNDVPVVAQHTGADSASVIYDAIESARARNIDVLIADTAGRLHTNSNLMEELVKVRRVMAKLDDKAPHEVLLVLDAGTGQNAVRQVQEFSEAVAVTGLAVTKLDGTARGGVVFALCKRYGLPVRYVGLGEGVDDLQVFNATAYVEGVLSENENTDDS
ncbi:MAG: signal recognition particle-docking protein FtsY [Gammaproteobacteria bacterium]|nr:MAG: signal recognition particle-docking protein FtsY [Gammaproteobacteria bacterium]